MAFVHGRGVEAKGAAAIALALIHRRVGVAQQGFSVCAVIWVYRNASAETDENILPGDANGLLKGAIELVQTRRDGVGVLQVTGDDDKLVPAVAREDVVGPDMPTQPHADLLQQLIANAVPQAVIDALEIIHIQEHHCSDAVASLRAVYFGL